MATDRTKGEGVDLDTLMVEHQADLWRYLRYLGCDTSSAEEIAQETFVQILQEPPELRTRGETAAYLRNRARFLLLNTWRREERLARTARMAEAERTWALTARDGDLSEYRAALDHCLERLGSRESALLKAHYWEKLAVEESARRLGMKAAGVKTALLRIKSDLRECIGRQIEA